MFNGIIYNQGIVTKIVKRPKGLNIFIKSNLKLNSKDIGLSVACDGVCLTLISCKSKIMEFYNDELIILAAPAYENEIIESLLKNKIPSDNIISTVSNFGAYMEYIPPNLTIPDLAPWTKFRIAPRLERSSDDIWSVQIRNWKLE